jgi:hypothetical protein
VLVIANFISPIFSSSSFVAAKSLRLNNRVSDRQQSGELYTVMRGMGYSPVVTAEALSGEKI